MSAVTLSLDDLHELASGILVAHNTSEINADQVADALVAAEADGQQGHGASRIPSYAAQSRSGKVDGHAMPKLMKVGPAALRVDARSGFAYPALNLAVEALAELTSETGIAAAVVVNSHHSGVAGHHVEPLARRGLLGLSFGNGPQGIAPWGGNRGLFGTQSASKYRTTASRNLGPTIQHGRKTVTSHSGWSSRKRATNCSTCTRFETHRTFGCPWSFASSVRC